VGEPGLGIVRRDRSQSLSHRLFQRLGCARFQAAKAQDSPIQKFQIRVDQAAYTGLPVWIHADLPPAT
jgi:hypothetical protein